MRTKTIRKDGEILWFLSDTPGRFWDWEPGTANEAIATPGMKDFPYVVMRDGETRRFVSTDIYDNVIQLLLPDGRISGFGPPTRFPLDLLCAEGE